MQKQLEAKQAKKQLREAEELAAMSEEERGEGAHLKLVDSTTQTAA